MDDWTPSLDFGLPQGTREFKWYWHKPTQNLHFWEVTGPENQNHDQVIEQHDPGFSWNNYHTGYAVAWPGQPVAARWGGNPEDLPYHADTAVEQHIQGALGGPQEATGSPQSVRWGKLVSAVEEFPSGADPMMKYAEPVPLSKLLGGRDLERGPGGQHFDRADSWEPLVQDIQSRGILTPVWLEWSNADGMAYLGEGNTRLAVAQQIGMQTLPVAVYRKSMPLAGVSRGNELGPFKFNKRQWLLDEGYDLNSPQFERMVSDPYVPQYFKPHYLIGFLDDRMAKTADYQGWSNWETWNTALMIDNEQETNEQARALIEAGIDKGLDDEQLGFKMRDWAIPAIVGPHNQQAIEDAKEWNSIPEEERIDYNYEDFKEKHPDAMDLLHGLVGGPDVGDSEPTLIDPELVNWDEIVRSIKNELEENDNYEQQMAELQSQGLSWTTNHDLDTNRLRDAIYRYHGAVPEEQLKAEGAPFNDPRAYYNRNVTLTPQEFLQTEPHWDNYITPDSRVKVWNLMHEKHPGMPTYERDQKTDWNDPEIQAIVQADPNVQNIMTNGHTQRMHDYYSDLSYAISHGKPHPHIPLAQQALVQRGYSPEEIQQAMRQRWQWNPQKGEWIDLERDLDAAPPIDKSLDQPGSLTIPNEWLSSTRRSDTTWKDKYEYRIVDGDNKKTCSTCSAFKDGHCRMFYNSKVDARGYCTEWSQVWRPKTASIDELVQRVRDNLSNDLLHPKYKDNPKAHCYVATEALYHSLGPDAGYRPMRMKLEDGTVHWWLQGPNGEVIDPTSDQFETPPDYSQGRGGGFLTREPSARTRTLMDRMASNDWMADSTDSWHGPQSVDKFKIDVPGEAPGMGGIGHEYGDGWSDTDPAQFRSPCWCDCGKTMPHEWAGTCESGLNPTLPFDAKTAAINSVTLYHGTTNVGWEIAQRQGAIQAREPLAVATQVASTYGLDANELYNHMWFEFSRGRGADGVYLSAEPVTAASYAHNMNEMVEDALRTAFRMTNNDGIYPNAKYDPYKSFREQYYNSLNLQPVVLTIEVPIDAFDEQQRTILDKMLGNEPVAFKYLHPGKEIWGDWTLPEVPTAWVTHVETQPEKPHWAKTASSENWVWIDGKIGWGQEFADIAWKLCGEMGLDATSSKYISNMIARGLRPDGHNVAAGTVVQDYPQIWMSTVDRNAIWDDVTRDLQDQHMEEQRRLAMTEDEMRRMFNDVGDQLSAPDDNPFGNGYGSVGMWQTLKRNTMPTPPWPGPESGFKTEEDWNNWHGPEFYEFKDANGNELYEGDKIHFTLLDPNMEIPGYEGTVARIYPEANAFLVRWPGGREEWHFYYEAPNFTITQQNRMSSVLGDQGRATTQHVASMPWKFDLMRAVNQASYLVYHILYGGTPEKHQEMLQKYPEYTNPSYDEWEREMFERDIPEHSRDPYAYTNRYPEWESQQQYNRDDPNAITPTDASKNNLMELQFQERPKTIVDQANSLTNALKGMPPMNVPAETQTAIYQAFMEMTQGMNERAYDVLFRAGLNGDEIEYVTNEIAQIIAGWKNRSL